MCLAAGREGMGRPEGRTFGEFEAEWEAEWFERPHYERVGGTGKELGTGAGRQWVYSDYIVGRDTGGSEDV